MTDMQILNNLIKDATNFRKDLEKLQQDRIYKGIYLEPENVVTPASLGEKVIPNVHVQGIGPNRLLIASVFFVDDWYWYLLRLQQETGLFLVFEMLSDAMSTDIVGRMLIIK